MAVALPLLFRWLAGQPLLGGTQAYELIALLARAGIPSPLAFGIIIAGSIAAIACSVALTEPFLRRHLKPSEIHLTLGLAVASPAILATLFFPLHALFILLLACAAGLFVKKKYVTGLALFGLLLLLVGVTVVSDGTRSPASALVELGGLDAYGLFMLIAACIGAWTLWENKARNYFITLAIVALVTLSLFFPTLMVFGSLAVALVAGIGLARLRKQRWTFSLVRTLTMLLFLCGILFAAVSSLSHMMHAPPDAGLASGLAELRFSLPQGAVLTYPGYAPWVQHWTGQPVVTLSDADLDFVWYSRNLDNTTRVLDSQQVASIIITPEMRSGLVWSEEEQGLLFLLSHSIKFKRIPSPSTAEAWAYVPASS